MPTINLVLFVTVGREYLDPSSSDQFDCTKIRWLSVAGQNNSEEMYVGSTRQKDNLEGRRVVRNTGEDSER